LTEAGGAAHGSPPDRAADPGGGPDGRACADGRSARADAAAGDPAGNREFPGLAGADADQSTWRRSLPLLEEASSNRTTPNHTAAVMATPMCDTPRSATRTTPPPQTAGRCSRP